MKKSTLITLSSFVFLGIALVFGYLWFKDANQYRKGNDAYAQLSNQYVSVNQPLPPQQVIATPTHPIVETLVETPAPTSVEPTPLTPPPTSTPAYTPTPSPDDLDLIRIRNIISVDFEALQKVNPEIVGWIFSENTNINYPVLHGKDNTFYLTYLPDRTQNRLGSIFINAENKGDFSDDTTVIFGHNMQDNSMFATLELYKNQDYYNQHPSIYVLTPQAIYRIDLFAGYVISAADIKSLHFNFRDRRERDAFVRHAYERTVFKSNIKLDIPDQFVSLITCSYDIYDARFMLNGKLVKLTK